MIIITTIVMSMIIIMIMTIIVICSPSPLLMRPTAPVAQISPAPDCPDPR